MWRNLGGAEYGVSEDLVLGEQGGWDSKDIRRLRIDTLVVKKTVAEVDTDTGVAILQWWPLRDVGVRVGTVRARPTARNTTSR